MSSCFYFWLSLNNSSILQLFFFIALFRSTIWESFILSSFLFSVIHSCHLIHSICSFEIFSGGKSRGITCALIIECFSHYGQATSTLILLHAVQTISTFVSSICDEQLGQAYVCTRLSIIVLSDWKFIISIVNY